MAEWIEIPAHRELRVPRWELAEQFLGIDSDGQTVPVTWYAGVYRLQRMSNRKMFKFSTYYPQPGDHDSSVYMLEEV